MKKMNNIKYVIVALLITVLSIVFVEPSTVSAVDTINSSTSTYTESQPTAWDNSSSNQVSDAISNAVNSTINVPVITSAEMSKIEDKAIKITWDSKNVGSQYSVEVKNLITGGTKRFANSVTSYTYQGIVPYKTYQFQIRACTSETTCSAWSEIKEVSYDNTLQAIILDQSCMVITLKPGETVDLTVLKIIPSTAKPTITWTSSNPNVATVDQNGKVTAITQGESTVTASVGTVSTPVLIRVTDGDIALTGISLSTDKPTISIGETATVITKYIPEITTASKDVTWTTSDATIATIVDNGTPGQGTVTGLKVGKVTITATSKANPSLTASIEITVQQQTIPLQSIKIKAASYTILKGQTKTMTGEVEFVPSNTTVSRELEWTSANTSIATIDKTKGILKGIKAGTTQITVRHKTGGLTQAYDAQATFNVTVMEKRITGITISCPSGTLGKGKVTTLKVTAWKPADTTDAKTITWSTSNKKIASVNKNGQVTGVAAGSATITAKTVNGKTAKCTIKVVKTGGGGTKKVTGTPKPKPSPTKTHTKCSVSGSTWYGKNGISVTKKTWESECCSGWEIANCVCRASSCYGTKTTTNYCSKGCMSLNETQCKNCKGCTWNHNEGHCVGTNTGGSGAQKKATTKCTKKCGTGEQLTKSCTCTCKDGYQKVQGECTKYREPTKKTTKCTKTCGYGEKRSSSCTCVCKDGWHRVQGQCEQYKTSKVVTAKKTTKAPKCPAHEHAKNGNCVCDSGYERKRGDCFKVATTKKKTTKKATAKKTTKKATAKKTTKKATTKKKTTKKASNTCKGVKVGNICFTW